MILQNSINRLLHELVDGPDVNQYGFLLNPGSPGLLDILRQLDVSEATAVIAPGCSSIAAQANHIRFVLEVLNRKFAADPPIADEAWEQSWSVVLSSSAEWQHLLDQLQSEVQRWGSRVLAMPQPHDEDVMTEIVASVAHMAYHFGSIRQLLHFQFRN